MKEKRTSLLTPRNVVAIVPLWTCDQTRETTEASQDVGGRGAQACHDRPLISRGRLSSGSLGSKGWRQEPGAHMFDISTFPTLDGI